MNGPRLPGTNLPTWPGASSCYSRAYKLLDSQKLDSVKCDMLIEALNEGDEEYIKGVLLENLNP